MSSYIIHLAIAMVYHPYCYSYMLSYSLLWLPVVYYIYLASLQCCLVFYTQLLYYAYLGNKASEILIQKIFHAHKTIFLKVYSVSCVLSK